MTTHLMNQTKNLQATIEAARRESETNWKLLLDKVQKHSGNTITSAQFKRNSITTSTANIGLSNINIKTSNLSGSGVKRKLITTVNLNDYASYKNEHNQSENI
jgi:hypothetical protein